MNSIMAQLASIPVKMSVRAVLGYDVLGNNKPKNKVELLNIPAFFMFGEKDDFMDQVKFNAMFKRYRSEEKDIRVMQGQDHFSKRSPEDVNAAKQFLMKLSVQT